MPQNECALFTLPLFKRDAIDLRSDCFSVLNRVSIADSGREMVNLPPLRKQISVPDGLSA